MADLASDTQISRHRLSLRQVLLSAMVLLMFATVSAHAQQKIPKKAEAAFQKAYYDIGLEKFETARAYLEEAIRIFPEYEEARLFLADIHFQQKEYADAAEGYEWLLTRDDMPMRVDRYLARSYFETGRFDESETAILRYLDNEQLSPKVRREAERLLANARFSREAMKRPVDFHAVHLGPAVNSEHSEYMPMLNADETTVIFTRLIRGQEDLYVTGKRSDGTWKKAEPIDEGVINTGHNEGAHCISADGKLLLYTICNERNTRGSCDLYISKKRNGKWGAPQNIGPEVNSVSWDSQPTLSADGLTVYFVSNRHGGYGGKDIWVTHWENGAWTEPANLGPEINTPFDEQTPFIHFDNRTLYFSSDGHPGLGLHDIFFSRFENGTWSAPRNLGFPVNTNQIESGLTVSIDGSRAYYAAEREEGLGGLDIYEFELPDFAKPDRVTYVKARIVDKTTGKPVNADFLLNALDGKATIEGTTEEGEFLICLPSGSDYGLQVSSDGYAIESYHFQLADTVRRDAQLLTIEVESIRKGQKMVLRNVFFETDSYELLPASYAELNELVRLLKANPDRIVEISGHTDDTGNAGYNQELSRQRAESVVRYLTEHGIASDRLEAIGYGDTQPIADNATREGRSQNRRTEVRVLE